MKQKYQIFIAFTLMVLALMFISFIVGVHLSHQEHLQKAAWAEESYRREVEYNVRHIMGLYNCSNDVIFQEIMNTFDPVLVAIVIAIESDYRYDVVSNMNCRGLMQLSPDKLDDWQDIQANIRIGSLYLYTQLLRFGNAELAVAAYNAGPERVARYGGVPPYDETQKYVERLRQWLWYVYGTSRDGIDLFKLTRGNFKTAQK